MLNAGIGTPIAWKTAWYSPMVYRQEHRRYFVLEILCRLNSAIGRERKETLNVFIMGLKYGTQNKR